MGEKLALSMEKSVCPIAICACLNTPEQYSKLDDFQARCEKDSCKEESMKKSSHEAEGNHGNAQGRSGLPIPDPSL